MNDPDECLVTWPTDPTEGDLIAPNLRPQHACALPAMHVSSTEPFRYTVADGTIEWKGNGSIPCPHLCHCGANHDVRDVEPARS